MSSTGPDEGVAEKAWQLRELVMEAEGTLGTIDTQLGLGEDCKVAEDSAPDYTDVPRRLAGLIKRLAQICKRLEDIKVTVLELKDTVG